MENHTDLRIVDVERLGGGIMIRFDDDKSAIYSAALLYSMLAQAERLVHSETAIESSGAGKPARGWSRARKIAKRRTKAK